MVSPYHIHSLALAPLTGLGDADLDTRLVQGIAEVGEGRFLEFLCSNGLAPMWYEGVGAEKLLEWASETFVSALRRARFAAVARYMIQRRTLAKVRAALDGADLPHAIIKGAHIREVLYEIPAIRPAADVDVLVSKANRARAVRALVDAGCEFRPDPATISHEAVLMDGAAMIDLHWDILRPGRTRVDLTELLLETRRDHGGHWALADEASMFLMLVHPVFTKYATSPSAALVRAVDLMRWIETQDLDWDRVADWLQIAGLRVAAGLTLTWLETLTPARAPRPFLQTLRPGRLRFKYLDFWIQKNLATRFQDHPTLIKMAFTLAVHDRISDPLRVIYKVWQQRSLADAEVDWLRPGSQGNGPAEPTGCPEDSG
jgi:hypothetical protein